MAEHKQNQETQQPTDKKLSEAMDRGQFAKSHEVTLSYGLERAAVVQTADVVVPSAKHFPVSAKQF